MWQSSNPVLTNKDAFAEFYGKDMFATKADVTTLQGVINKTALLVGIAVASGAVGYGVFAKFPQIMWISAIASLVVCLGVAWKLCKQPALSKVLAPIYAVVEGVFLGAFTAVADTILVNQGIKVAGGVGVQAFIVTAACMTSMLLLYKTGIVRPTDRFKAIIGVATGGIMLAYLVSFVLSIFWQPLPLISFASAVQDKGMMGFLGLGINVLILGIASLWLVIDFGTIEDNIRAGAPKSMEWYCAFGLLVTLAWIYFEAVKLVVRVASLFGNRN
jgi:uncharacterized YccA/Bax inhibitor family protein